MLSDNLLRFADGSMVLLVLIYRSFTLFEVYMTVHGSFSHLYMKWQ